MLTSARLPVRSILGALVAVSAFLELVGFNWYELAVIATVLAAGLVHVDPGASTREPIASARLLRR